VRPDLLRLHAQPLTYRSPPVSRYCSSSFPVLPSLLSLLLCPSVTLSRHLFNSQPWSRSKDSPRPLYAPPTSPKHVNPSRAPVFHCVAEDGVRASPVATWSRWMPSYRRQHPSSALLAAIDHARGRIHIRAREGAVNRTGPAPSTLFSRRPSEHVAFSLVLPTLPPPILPIHDNAAHRAAVGRRAAALRPAAMPRWGRRPRQT
jgi:hypothetical protein